MTIEINKDWTLFLDRDGVINRRLPGEYIRSFDEFEFLPGVLDALSQFSKMFGLIIIATNQQGIEKGLMTVDDLDHLHRNMLHEIEKHGGRIDKIYYCSDLAHKPDNCRKPSSAMGITAKKDFPKIKFEKSIMVGDSDTDIGFGQNLGMKTILVGEQLKSGSDIWTPDFILDHLANVPDILRYKTI